MSRPPVIIFSCLQFHEPHQHRSALCAGRGVSRDDCRVGHAGDDAALDHPSHRRLGVIANAASAGEHAKAVAARQLPGVRAWSQAGLVAGHSQKTLVGADAPNPKNTKSSRPVPGAFFGGAPSRALIFRRDPDGTLLVFLRRGTPRRCGDGRAARGARRGLHGTQRRPRASTRQASRTRR